MDIPSTSPASGIWNSPIAKYGGTSAARKQSAASCHWDGRTKAAMFPFEKTSIIPQMLRLFRYQRVYGCTSTSMDAKRAARLGNFAEDRPWCRMVKTQILGQLPMCSPPAAVDHPRLASSRDVQFTSGYASISCFPEATQPLLVHPAKSYICKPTTPFPLCTLASVISFDDLAKEQGEYL